MALVPCPECQKEVSTEARACPQCAFPFPGKNVSQEGRPTGRLNTCPQCHRPVSKHVQACPHCGVLLIRKVAQSIKTSAGSKGMIPSIRTGNLLKNTGIRDSHFDTYRNVQALQGSRRRPPLWQDPSVFQEASSPRHRRSKKNSIIVGLILLVIVTMSVVFGAIWQLKGLNPWEALIYWRM